MEWVEVRGETLEAAKEHALDQLGVALDDAEFEVVQVPESRWLGLKKTEARVRARVRPTQARPKKENRPRRGRKGEGETGGADDTARGDRSRAPRSGAKPRNGGRDGGRESGGSREQGGREQGGRGQNGRTTESAAAVADAADVESRPDSRQADRPVKKKESTMRDESTGELVPLEEQTAMVETFLSGVLEGFGLEGTVTTRVEDDDIVGEIEGNGLGLLIGPKGGTIRALQEVTRAAAQRHADGRDTRRTNVDVGGYRERRREALVAFAARQAEVVRTEGRRVALEPMGSSDRKIIHDAVMEIDGVRSISEGDDPRRRVVLLPDD